MEAFPQAQKYIPSYQDGGQGGDQQQILMQYLQAFAQLQGMPVEQLMQSLQQMPEQQQSQAIQQIVQMVDQVMSQQGGQGQDMAQSGQMPMDPSQAMQMAMGGSYNLKKFTDNYEPYPAAAALPDDNIYRTFPPNIPRLFGKGGMYQAPDDTKSNETASGQNCPFGHHFDPNVGNCVPYAWYTASKFVGGTGAVLGLGATVPYLMERSAVEPGRRPIRGFGEGQNFVMENLEKSKIGDKIRNWSYFGEEIPLQRTEYEYERTGPKSGKKTTMWSHADDPNFQKKVLNDKNVKATGNERTIETGEKYLKHSDYGNAKWVEENITKKFKITPEEWAKMGTTPEGKILQRSFVNGLKNPNYAAVMKGLETTLLKYKKAPLSVKIGILTPLIGLGAYGIYNWMTSPDEETQQPDITNQPAPVDSSKQNILELYLNQLQRINGNTPPVDPYDSSVASPFKMGGSSSPMGYGSFPAIMKTGGSFSNAAPDIYDTEGYLQNYNDNEFKRYIQENIDNSIYERGLKTGMNPGMDQITPMQMQVRRGGSSKKKELTKHQFPPGQTGYVDLGSEFEQFANDAQQVQAEQQARFATDPTYTGGVTDYELAKEAERQKGMQSSTSGMIGPPKPDYILDREFAEEQKATMPGSTARFHYTPQGEYTPGMEQSKKEKAARDMAAASCPTGMVYDDKLQKCVSEGKCPKGQKWDPVRQECYREKYVSNQANANKILFGLNMAGMGVDRASGNKRKEENKQIISTLADNVIPKKDYNGVDFYGYEDVNTFTPNPRYGTYNRSVYQPPGSEYMADGGEIKYLTKKQINDILAAGGQLEFL